MIGWKATGRWKRKRGSRNGRHTALDPGPNARDPHTLKRAQATSQNHTKRTSSVRRRRELLMSNLVAALPPLRHDLLQRVLGAWTRSTARAHGSLRSPSSMYSLGARVGPPSYENASRSPVPSMKKTRAFPSRQSARAITSRRRAERSGVRYLSALLREAHSAGSWS